MCSTEFSLNFFYIRERANKEGGAFSLSKKNIYFFWWSNFCIFSGVVCNTSDPVSPLFLRAPVYGVLSPLLKLCSVFQCFSFIFPVGFRRKEFRGKLAIAITANFINRNTTAEAKVEEISGVAFIFNQKFFQDLREATGMSAIVQFPVTAICLLYYNFYNLGITIFSQQTKVMCKEVSHFFLSLKSNFPHFYSCSICLYKADVYHSDVCHFCSELISLGIFRKSEPFIREAWTLSLFPAFHIWIQNLMWS